MEPEALIGQAQAWLAVDPDPETRAEISALIADRDLDGLAERFGARLTFGTAGLRGVLGGGPNRMNRVVVRQAASGLVAHLDRGARVVIGYDARSRSDVFATETAAIVAASGGQALLFDHVVPTPVLAFAVTHLGADAGVMVTASHNPPADNGYKVYAADGAQIVPPADREIEAAIAAGGLPPLELDPPADGGAVEVVPDSVVNAYVAAIVEPTPNREPVRVAYTPLHGVALDTLRLAFDQAGLDAPAVVAAQAEPDGRFPTVAFPNPEEPGALDLLMELGAEVGADVLLANDPDGDRLAAAMRTQDGDGAGDGDGWRVFTGDELGALLAAYLIETGEGSKMVLATTIVSSRLLGRMAEAAALPFVRTLTGFKWIARAADDLPGARLGFGYEEALGYSVGDAVRDKDGISAAVAFVRAFDFWRAAGLSPLDVLDDLALRHGVHATGQITIRLAGDAAAEFMTGLRADPPPDVAGAALVEVIDRIGGGELPPADVLEWYLGDGTRIIVRPSGTEPKVKLYVETVEPVVGGEVAAARDVAAARLQAALTELASMRSDRWT